MGAQAADRLSLTVSGLLVGGLVLIAFSLLLQEQARIPLPAQPVAPSAAPVPAAMPAALHLPPPPPSSVPVAAPAVLPRLPDPVPPARVVEPLRAASTAPKAAPPRGIVPLGPSPSVSQSRPAEQSATPSPVIDAALNRKDGGALLRLLEHGKGPAIEIAWPRSQSDQMALYRLLTRCYGMQAAVLGSQSHLFIADTPAGESWDLDRDRVSGFLRAPRGATIPEESRVFARIARHHSLAGWRPVRVFPRDVDAALLGGLARLLGPRYRSARSITASYVPQASGLKLERFSVDGVAVAGGIALAPQRAGCG